LLAGRFVNPRDASGQRGDFDKDLLVGRSLQFRPLSQTHIDSAALVGGTHPAPGGKPSFMLSSKF
jgi:hypothetical protein